MPLNRDHRWRFWLAGLAGGLLLLYVLRTVLLPFIAGMAIAYFLDPLVQSLERRGLSRVLATSLITLFFFGVVVLTVSLTAPLLEHQIAGFISKLPAYKDALINKGMPLWKLVKRQLTTDDLDRVRDAASGYAGTAASYLVQMLGGVLSGSLVLVNLLSLIFITPVVTFYLLRDWESFTRRVRDWLPRPLEATVCQLTQEIDQIIAGFVRGQALVCLSLAVFYGAGLTLIDLDLGLVLGLAIGALSFIPYVGMLTGLVVAVGLALAQGDGWNLLLLVGVVFVIGNILEGNVLSPKLVGERIGLHPVWIIFAILAGGALFGFAGVLLALPMAAVIGVLTRFALSQYLKSPLYSGDFPEGTAP